MQLGCVSIHNMSKPKQGRPVSGTEPKRRYQVTLRPRIADKLRDFGGDNLSRGIELAARNMKAKPTCPVHGSAPCLRWYASDGRHGHPTADDLRRALASGDY